MGSSEGRDRNHGTISPSDKEKTQIVAICPVDAVEHIEVIYIQRAGEGFHC